MEVGALFKILLVFAGVLLLIRIKCPMGPALVAGGLALGLWAGRPVMQVAADLGYALRLPELWLLLLIMALVFEYGRYLAEERNAQVIINGARAWGGRHGRAVSLMAMPAMIGLVPMPGGAVFSAPLVGQAVQGGDWDPVWKASVNYWFRHIWEYWWPMFPVVIVTLSIFDLSTVQFALLQLPLSLAALGGGYLVFIRPHLEELAQPVEAGPPASRRGWKLALPLAIVIAASLWLPPVVGRMAPHWTGQTHKLVAMLVGLLAGLVPLLRDCGPGSRRRFVQALYEPKMLGLLVTVGGVIVFKALLERSGLLPLAGQDLVASGVPILWVVALLPLVAGLVTGIAIGFAAIAFPLLAGLAADPATGLAPASTLVLGFAFGYAGMMCSPVHLCFILSRGFFSASLARMYKYIVPCSLFPLATAGLLYALLRAAGW